MLEGKASFIGIKHEMWSSREIIALEYLSKKIKVVIDDNSVQADCPAVSQGFSHSKS